MQHKMEHRVPLPPVKARLHRFQGPANQSGTQLNGKGSPSKHHYQLWKPYQERWENKFYQITPTMSKWVSVGSYS